MLKVGLSVNAGVASTGAPPALPATYTPSDFSVTHGIQDFFAEFYAETSVVIRNKGILTFTQGGTFDPSATITAYHNYGSGDEAVFYIEDVSFTIDSVQLNAGTEVTTTLFLSTDTFTVTDDVVMVKEAIPEGDIKYVIEFFLALPTPNGIYLNSTDTSVTLETTVLGPDISEAAVLVYDLGDVSITESPSPNTVTVDLQLNFQVDPTPYTAPVDPQPLVFNIPSKLTAKQEIEGVLLTIFEKENTSITFTETEVPPSGGVINGQIVYNVNPLLQDIPIQAGPIVYTFEITPTDIGYDPYTEGVFSTQINVAQTLLQHPYENTFTIEEYSASYLGSLPEGDFLVMQALVTFDASTTGPPLNPLGLSLNVVGTQTINGQQVTVFNIPNVDFYYFSTYSQELSKYVYFRNIVLPNDLGPDGCLATIQSNVPLDVSINIPEGTTAGDFTIAAADSLNYSLPNPFVGYTCDVIEEQPLLASSYYSMSRENIYFNTGFYLEGPVLFFSIFYGFTGINPYTAQGLSNFEVNDLVSKTFSLRVGQTTTDCVLVSPQSYIYNHEIVYFPNIDYLHYRVDFSVDLTTATYSNNLYHDPTNYGWLFLNFKIPSGGTVFSQNQRYSATSNANVLTAVASPYGTHASSIIKYKYYNYPIDFTV